jgi:RPA family protein
MAEKTFIREPSKRMFSEEFRQIKFTKKYSGDEKAPSFALTPTGAIANRILIAGIMTMRERMDDKNNTYRAVINDNTGNFYVKASSFQPEALHKLAKIATPAFVTVVAKPNVYTNDAGRIFVSARIEDVGVTDRETREQWIIDTSVATLERIRVMEQGKDPAVNEIKAMYSPNLTEYKETVKKALNSVLNK